MFFLHDSYHNGVNTSGVKQILYHSPDLLCLQEVQTFLVEKPDGTVMTVWSGHLARENHVSWFGHWLRSAEYGFRYARKRPYSGQHCQGVTIGKHGDCRHYM